MMEPAARDRRSEVIEGAINVEWLMSALISQHYMKRVDSDLMFQVLYDEYFSFALKRRIVEKIVHLESHEAQSLNRLNSIRNCFAHCAQQVATATAPDEFFVPDPRNPDRPIDFDALYSEFIELLPQVEVFLVEAFKSRGGVLLDKPPF